MVEKIGQIKRAILPILRRHKVRHAAIFGSFSRGEAKKSSDVDILVEFRKTPSLFDIGGLYADLQEKLHRKVDVVIYDSIDPRLRESILSNKIDIL